jgi:hypothetical protein
LRPQRVDGNGKITHSATWIIRDGEYQQATGCGEYERAEAENQFQKFLETKAPEDITSYVYFLTAKAPNFPIKIGITTAVAGRFHQIQCALP